jgi:hypothetical protein
MNKKVLFLIILIILSSQLVLAATSDIAPSVVEGNINSLIVQENSKTRSELKAYFDQKFDKWLNSATQKAESFLNDNFVQLDNMIKSQVQKYYIKLEIGLIAGLFFSSMLIYFVIMLIRRWLNRKAIAERKIIFEWLEAHEKEVQTMREFDKEMRELVDWLKKIKDNAPKDEASK